MGEIAKKEDSQIVDVQSYNKLIEIAITSPDADVSKLEKLMELQERWEERQAKKAFVQAMACFKKNKPTIKKDKKGHHGYKYASLEQIDKQIKDVLYDCGLDYRFEQGLAGNEMQVSCIVTHIDGHSERTMMSAPADDGHGKNNIQALGSTNSYLQRYTLIGALALTSADTDDDGMSVGGITTSSLLDYAKCLRKNWTTMNAMKEFLAVDDLDSAAEAWHELDDKEKEILKRGSTKGGSITPEESRKILDDPKKRFVTRIEAE